MLHQLGVRGRLLDNRTTWREVALQHCDATLRVDRIFRSTYHVLFETGTCGLDFLTQRATCDGHRIQMQ